MERLKTVDDGDEDDCLGMMRRSGMRTGWGVFLLLVAAVGRAWVESVSQEVDMRMVRQTHPSVRYHFVFVVTIPEEVAWLVLFEETNDRCECEVTNRNCVDEGVQREDRIRSLSYDYAQLNLNSKN